MNDSYYDDDLDDDNRDISSLQIHQVKSHKNETWKKFNEIYKYTLEKKFL